MILHDIDVNHSRMIKLSKFAKRYAKTCGCEISVEERENGKFNVKIFQERTRVDKYGNRYVEKGV